MLAYRKLREIMQSNGVRKPKFLLTVARDRLGREALATQVEALCDDAGCKVWSDRTGRPVEGNIGQIYAAGMENTMSRAESKQTQHRRQGTVLIRVKEKGLPYGKPEYGYKTVRNERGKSIGVEIDPVRAPIRQLIDEWYIAGNSPVVIAKRLQSHYEDGQTEYVPPAGKLWHPNVVRKLLKSIFPSGVYRAHVSGEDVEVIGKHPRLRSEEQQTAIDRQFARRSRGTQRGNIGPARYYGIAFCADCGAKMIRMHSMVGTRNLGIDYTCSSYRYSLRTTKIICSTHYTYESSITAAIIEFFQQPVDIMITQVLEHAPKDRSNDLELAKARLEKARNKKVELIKLQLEYPGSLDAFKQVMDETEQTEKVIVAEIQELEANQIRLPDLDGIRNWVTEMLSIDNLRDWLMNEDPNVIRSIFGQRIRVMCYQRKYHSNEPYPTVELCL